MRVGINMPFTDGDGAPLDVTGVARRALTLQALGNGRLTLGVGAASRPEPHDSMGTDHGQRVSKL